MKLISTILFIIIIAPLNSCKENSVSIDPIVNTHRVKTILEKQNGYENWRCDLSYEHDKLIEVSSFNNYNNSWRPEELTQITYNANEIKALSTEWRNNKWQTKYGFNYLMHNSKLIEYELLNFYNDTWIKEGKYVYTYQSGDLTERKYLKLSNGEEKEMSKLELSYHDGNIDEIKIYYSDELNKWLWVNKQSFDYRHEGVTEIYFYEKDEFANWKLQQRTQLKYINNKLSESYIYTELTESNLWHLSNSTIYLYDSNDYLYRIIEGDGYETEFIYEEGNGNASLFYSSPLMRSMHYPTLKKSVSYELKTLTLRLLLE